MYEHCKSFLKKCLYLVYFLLFFAQNSVANSVFIEKNAKSKYIDLTFAGDIMAHAPNFKMKDYNKIYKDCLNILRNDDLSFCNVETPINNELEYETYPTFNVHSEYVDATIKAGFEVFSTSNNHTNDQGKAGINSTYEYFESLEESGIYMSGIKKDKNVEFSWKLIDVKGWKILYCAMTEFLNAYHSLERIDYVPTTKKARDSYLEFLTNLRAENPCDVFIVGIHVSEPEYIRTVPQSRKDFFYSVLDAGVDIIWANHPHVTQEWELIQNEETGKINKMIMYSIGNTISAQRGYPNYDEPGQKYEYTGDSLLMEVSLVQDKDGFYIDFVYPTLITTHIDTKGDYIIKLLSNSFIEQCSKKDRAYYKERLELMQKINGKTICR